MSNMSFGMVFTSKWLEVWKIGKGNTKKSYNRSEFIIPDDDKDIEKDLKSALTEQGYSLDPKQEMFGVYVPDNLKKALVCGITRDGSLKAAEKLARSLLFSPEVLYVHGDVNETFNDLMCDAVIIGGGFDDSDDEKTRKLILDIGESEWFKKHRPLVIYAGNRESVSTAQLKFSPFSDFYEMKNVLEDGSSDNDRNSLMEIDRSSFFAFSDNDLIKLSTYQESLHGISGYLCGAGSGRVISAMIRDDYSVLSQCRMESGKPVVENIALSKNAEDLCPDDFSDSYREFSVEENSVAGDLFTARDILAIGRKRQSSFFRPDRILGISLTEEVDVKKFLDLVSDPDIVRGVIEYYFDRTGFFLMCGSILSSSVEKTEELTEKLIEDQDFCSGWLVIPDGDFVKDEIALEVYIGGDENDKTSQLFWGKRYTIPVKEDSVIELRLKGTAFLAGKRKVVVLRTGKKSKNLVVDIRKEKS